MPARRKEPAYQHHRASGQARVRIDGKDRYLGEYDSPQSRELYEDAIHEWRIRQDTSQVFITIDDLCLKFMDHAEVYYLHRDGTATGEAENLRHALRFLVKKFGTCRVRDFGPLKLKTVRESMIDAGLCRTTINRSVHRIRRAFAWGVENELVDESKYRSLCSVSALKAGRTQAHESDPVKPVDMTIVDATMPHLSRIVGHMVQLQLLTGMRPKEVCSIRPCDVSKRDDGIWVYDPYQHKTEHHGRDRRIAIGQQGQAILAPYLDRDPETFCFTPAEQEADRNKLKKANRSSPMTPSQAKRKPVGRTFKPRYTKDSYRRAIERGCEKAFNMPMELRDIRRTIARSTAATEAEREKLRDELRAAAAEWRANHYWAPNQLRHTRGTVIRKKFGIEATRTVLGHSETSTTEIYAERDFETAVEIMREIG